MGQPKGDAGSFEARQVRAKNDVEAVVRRFRENPSEWRELRERLANVDSDDQRVELLVEFATSERELARITTPKSAELVAATPTVTTVTVTTVTTV